MRAPKKSIFETAANLELWPKILPHYRYIRYLERSPDRNVVVMAATRSGIPISWTSEQIIDRGRLEVRFHHLKAFTKGMRVGDFFIHHIANKTLRCMKAYVEAQAKPVTA